MSPKCGKVGCVCCRHAADIRMVGKRDHDHPGWSAARRRETAVCYCNLHHNQCHVLHGVLGHLYCRFHPVTFLKLLQYHSALRIEITHCIIVHVSQFSTRHESRWVRLHCNVHSLALFSACTSILLETFCNNTIRSFVTTLHFCLCKCLYHCIMSMD